MDAHRSLGEQLDEAKAKHPGLRVVLLTTPNNPTGEVIRAEGEESPDMQPGTACMSSRVIECQHRLKTFVYALAHTAAVLGGPEKTRLAFVGAVLREYLTWCCANKIHLVRYGIV